MHVNTLTLELTRKCNLKCEHCLRGNAQNKSMSEQTMLQIFNHIDSVDTLSIGGGEPSLAIKELECLYNVLVQTNTQVQDIFLVTNGKKVSKPLIKSFAKLYSLLPYPEWSQFGISNDIYHVAERGYHVTPASYVDELYDPKNTDLHNLPESIFYTHLDGDRMKIFARGRAKNWGDNYDPYLDNIRLNSLSNPTVIDGEMYIAYDGTVVGDANMSYNDMRKYSRGNVHQWFDLMINLAGSTNHVHQEGYIFYTGEILAKYYNLLKRYEN